MKSPFTREASFDWRKFESVVRIFTRMLDNVADINGLPLAQQQTEILSKRRHGMGYLGLGSALAMLRIRYGSEDSEHFVANVGCRMAMVGYETGIELAREKGPAPIFNEEFEVTAKMLRCRPEMVAAGYAIGDKVLGRVLYARFSRYMQRLSFLNEDLTQRIAEEGCRFTHHTSIAPTGTIALSLGNNASNGIEPSFAHRYTRNVIREGKKSKESVEVMSYELLKFRECINPCADPDANEGPNQLPAYFVTADSIDPREHVKVQSAAQLYCDSSISKTINVATDYPFDEFKEIYLYAAERNLKGCTTFRFNPEVFSGVLVKSKDLAATEYVFQLEDGSEVRVRGDEQIEYDGEVHTAANLFDALKEGYYGKF